MIKSSELGRAATDAAEIQSESSRELVIHIQPKFETECKDRCPSRGTGKLSITAKSFAFDGVYDRNTV